MLLVKNHAVVLLLSSFMSLVIISPIIRCFGLFQEESFLEDINMILNTADIPNLYDNEERLEIIEKVSIRI